MSKLTLCGADLGRGRCKIVVAVLEGGQVVRVARRQYPTVLGQKSGTSFAGVMGAGTALNGTSVRVEHPTLGVQVREVGENALAHSEAAWASRSRHQADADLVALLAYGLKTLGVSGDVHLCVGTPAQFYDAQKEHMVGLFKGQWCVDGVSVNFVNVNAIPQPAGTAWNLVADYKTGQAHGGADVYLKGRIGICDVGEYSTDGGVLRRMAWQGNRVVTLELGVGKLKAAIAGHLTGFGYPMRPYQASDALERGEVALVRSVVDLSSVIEDAVELYGQDIVNEFGEAWPDREEYDRVVITAGGAYYFGSFLQNVWEPRWWEKAVADRRVVVVSEEAEWSNVSGYAALLHWSYRQRVG